RRARCRVRRRRGTAGPRCGGTEAGVSAGFDTESGAARATSAGLDPARFVREDLRALRPYHLDLAPCRFKLDQNEVPWDLPRRLKRAICDRLLEADWARYPDFHAENLRAALGRAHGLPAEGVLVGNGSNELLGVALAALAG